ncbi:ABC transporter ATP-binding protein [Puteibacter caeruleilacunae]|nr:ABC transporter ATP-binding protein [Puteibacter caeruleilacunae]
MIEIKNITKIYNKEGAEVRALDDYSLSIEKGEFVAIQGASGCGKTTLLLSIGGLLSPDKGSVVINGNAVYDMPVEERTVFRAKTMGFVFQQYHLIPYLNVLENIRVPALAAQGEVPEERLEMLIKTLGLKERINHTPAELSAGEKQRTALARALLFEPDILLADEITGNLDEKNVEIVMNCLFEYQKAGGTIVLVSHDTALCKRADRIEELTVK